MLFSELSRESGTTDVGLVNTNMDSDGVSIIDVKSGDPDVESSELDLVVEISSNGEMTGDLKNASEVLTGVELDLAYISEKLLNLNVFMMHVATKESDFETLASANGDASIVSMEKVLEFDMLSGILDLEVSELDNFMEILHRDIFEAGEMISSYGHLGDAVMAMKEKLRDSEESLKQSQDQVSEIRVQSAKFQRTLACFKGEENENAYEGPNSFNTNQKINVQNAEQQRHILRMLEKSLAREMDLEKKLVQLRQIEDELKHRLLSLEQEALFMEEEAMDISGRNFEAENAAEVLMGISKDLLGQLQILKFNFNGSVKRESDLRSKLEKSIEQLQARDEYTAKLNDLLITQTGSLKSSLTKAENKLVLANSEASTLQEKMSALENQLKESELNAKQHDVLLSEVAEMKIAMEDLKEKLSKAESRAEFSEAKCKSYEEIKTQLLEELGRLKGTSVKVDLLERQLGESNIKLQHAVAYAEASQEKQMLLNSTIVDMENLIEDLKSKVAKAERRADSMEDECIKLSEANAELNEELNFLRGRLECVEASLNHAEETRIATAKDIAFRTKVITDLIMQLAIERERLHKQISSLAMENKTLVMQLHQARKKPADFNSHHDGNGENILNLVEEVTEISAIGSKVDKTLKTTTVDDTEVTVDDTEVAAAEKSSESELESVRRIDASLLNYRHIFIAMLIVLVSATVYMFHPQTLRL